MSNTITRYEKALQGGLRACNNHPQPNPYILVLGVVEDCCMLSVLLALPSCICIMVSSLHPTSFFTMIFILVSKAF